MASPNKRILSILLSIAIAVSSSGNLYAADQPIQTTIDTLNAVRNDLANFQTALEQIIARQATIENAQRYKDETKEELKNEAQTKQAAAKAALEHLNKANPDVLGPELTGKLKACFGSLVEAADKSLLLPDSKEKFVTPCNREQIQSLIDQVKEKRRQAVETWAKCRAKIVNASIPNTSNKVVDPAELPATLPSSKSGSQSSIDSYLADLLKSFPADSEQRACVMDMQISKAQVDGSDDTYDDVEKMLEFAGAVCALSGANPIVCGVFGGFVALLELARLLGFDRPIGKPAKGGSDKAEGGKPTPGTPGGKPDGFGTSATGSIMCTRIGKAVTCSKAGYSSITYDPTPGDNHFIDKHPDENERKMIENAVGNGEAKKFYYCERPPGNKSFMFGFLFFEGSKYYPVSVSLIGPDAKMGFQAANDIPNGAKNEELCAAFAK